jgi:hypothetical protein
MNKKYIPTIIILFFGFFQLKSQLPLDGCNGMIGYLMSLFRWIIIITILGFVTFSWLAKTERPKYNYSPLIATTIIAMLSVVVSWSSENVFINKDLLIATKKNDYAPRTQQITLKENGKYSVELHYIEWTCKYSGNYTRTNDSLKLDNSIISQTDSAFNNLYLFTLDRNFLQPIYGNKVSLDSSNWLTVKK